MPLCASLSVKLGDLDVSKTDRSRLSAPRCLVSLVDLPCEVFGVL